MDPLIAEALRTDQRFIQAKKQILDVVKEYQSQIKGVRAPTQERKIGYEELLKSYGESRGTPLWHPYMGSGMGRGALVELADGSIKYDLINGIGVHWGHEDLAIVSSSLDAAVSDIVMQGNLQQNVDIAKLAELILQHVHLDHIFFTSSGAMACENALKIVFQKKFPASRLLAFEHCFMGRTTTLSQLTDKPAFREGLPLNVPVDYIPFYDPKHPSESTSKAVNTLKTFLHRYPGKYAAMCCELIQGEGGFNVGHSDFFTALFDILKQEGVAIFIDEVQTFGRTPKLFAFQHFDLEEYVDVVTIGKISQICATLYKTEYKPRPGLLSQTFIGSTSAIHASRTIIESLLHNDYLGTEGKIARLHRAFVERLEQIGKKTQGLIKGPYGIGCMLAFTAFEGDKAKSMELIHSLFEAGLIVFFAGEDPTRIRCLLPAGGISFDDIDPICRILEQTILTTAGR